MARFGQQTGKGPDRPFAEQSGKTAQPGRKRAAPAGALARIGDQRKDGGEQCHRQQHDCDGGPPAAAPILLFLHIVPQFAREDIGERQEQHGDKAETRQREIGGKGAGLAHPVIHHIACRGG